MILSQAHEHGTHKTPPKIAFELDIDRTSVPHIISQEDIFADARNKFNLDKQFHMWRSFENNEANKTQKGDFHWIVNFNKYNCLKHNIAVS